MSDYTGLPTYRVKQGLPYGDDNFSFPRPIDAVGSKTIMNALILMSEELLATPKRRRYILKWVEKYSEDRSERPNDSLKRFKFSALMIDGNY